MWVGKTSTQQNANQPSNSPLPISRLLGRHIVMMLCAGSLSVSCRLADSSEWIDHRSPRTRPLFQCRVVRVVVDLFDAEHVVLVSYVCGAHAPMCIMRWRWSRRRCEHGASVSHTLSIGRGEDSSNAPVVSPLHHSAAIRQIRPSPLGEVQIPGSPFHPPFAVSAKDCFCKVPAFVGLRVYEGVCLCVWCDRSDCLLCPSLAGRGKGSWRREGVLMRKIYEHSLGSEVEVYSLVFFVLWTLLVICWLTCVFHVKHFGCGGWIRFESGSVWRDGCAEGFMSEWCGLCGRRWMWWMMLCVFVGYLLPAQCVSFMLSVALAKIDKPTHLFSVALFGVRFRRRKIE